MAFNETISIGSKADTRGFKKAETAAAKLTKQVRSLAGALGVGLGTAAIVKFGKDSVKAFTDAEKSNTQLANSVKNLGLAFAQSNITNFLDKISASSGIAGEKLNESFQALLTTSGSFLKSQELLQLALDVSAGSTVDLVTVSKDLAQAYVGNTRGLRKYDLGLTQAQLKVASFTSLQQKLQNQFSGANQAFLNTYAGKMQVLAEAAGNAQEIIGQGLVDALTLAAGKGADIQDVANAMASLAEDIADTARGVGVLVNAFEKLDKRVSGGTLGKIISGGLNLGLLGALRRLGDEAQERPRAGRRFMGGAQANLYDADAAAQKKFQQQQKKLSDAQTKATKALTAEQKKQLALKKAGSIFDLEQIQVVAALKGKLSDEDRKKVELQFALLTGNTKQATALTLEIAKAQGLGKDLAEYLANIPDAKNPFASWEAYLDMLMAKAQKVASVSGTVAVAAASNVSSAGSSFYVGGTKVDLPSTNVATMPKPAATATSGGGQQATTYVGGTPIYVQIDGKTIASALQDSSLSGIGSSVNRTGR
jgi:hypothetical protein